MKILKPENIGAYLAEAEKRGILPMFFLELCSGLRKGELLALLWTDLDVERQTISVSKQAVRVKGGRSGPQEDPSSRVENQAGERGGAARRLPPPFTAAAMPTAQGV